MVSGKGSLHKQILRSVKIILGILRLFTHVILIKSVATGIAIHIIRIIIIIIIISILIIVWIS